jgi:hypothetical protein
MSEFIKDVNNCGALSGYAWFALSVAVIIFCVGLVHVGLWLYNHFKYVE